MQKNADERDETTNWTSGRDNNRGQFLKFNSNNSIRNSRMLLVFGVYIGPLISASIFLVCSAAMNWAHNTIVDYGLFPVSLGTGSICIFFYKRPTGIQWLLFIPYLLVYSLILMVFTIVFSVFLGAPK